MARPSPPRWPLRGPVLLGALALILLLCGFGSWAAFARIDGAIMAEGQVAVPGNRRIVQHPDGGVVARVPVAAGAQIAAGDILLELDGAALRSDMALLEAQLRELLARRARLEGERDGAPTLVFDARLEDAPDLRTGQLRLYAALRQADATALHRLRTRADQVREQIAGLSAQQGATASQLALVKQDMAAQQRLLDKGLAPAARLNALARETARLQGAAGDLSARRAQAHGRITELQIEMDTIPAQRREAALTQLRDLRHRLLELEERRGALATRLDGLTLRAPVAGTLHEMRISGPGAVLRAAEPVAIIVPHGRADRVEARLSPLDIDRVRPGLPVTLRLPALGQDPAGERQGVVAHVSPDVFDGAAAGQQHFRVQIDVPPREQPQSALKPGMAVQVFIRTGTRSPIAYLTAPLRGYLERALRE